MRIFVLINTIEKKMKKKNGIFDEILFNENKLIKNTSIETKLKYLRIIYHNKLV